jgi:5'-nucleotidase
MDAYIMDNRRHFIKKSAFGSVGLIGLKSFSLADLPRDEVRSLTIAHTNDMHSHIDPFPPTHHEYPGQGGMESRATELDQLRARYGELLLLDSGDIFQGTPYFNYFGGRLELELMSMMGYDAATMGNHDFDGGMDGFLRAQKRADFPFICSNYDMSDSPLNGQTIGHKVIKKQGIKVGLFGLGVELEGLVEGKLYKGVRYMDPVAIAKEKVALLRGDEKCDIVICLSHLGFRYQSMKISDVRLAEEVSGMDLILGGHTHTFLDQMEEVTHAEGWKTRINQVGWAGLRLGVIHLVMSKEDGRKVWTQ